MIPGMIAIVAPNVPIEASSLTWLARGTAAGTTSKTITGISAPTEVIPPNERWIVVCIQSLAATPASISGTPTINSNNAPVISSGLTGSVLSLNTRYSWFAANVPTGTTIDIAYTSTETFSNQYQIFQAINLDFSAATDSAYDAGSNQADLAIDCPADGVILGSGSYNYSGGSTPTSANFANLTTLDFVDASSGFTASGTIFGSAQTALDVTYDPIPNTNLTRATGSVIAAAAKTF